MDIEATESIHTLKLLEAIERNFTCSGNELQQFGTLLFVVRSNCSPEPLNLWGRCIVVVKLGITLPVIHINVGQSRDKEFQLLLIEN
jgi:hypothetical protein